MWNRRDRFEDDMREELRSHIAEYADELRRAGMPDDEADRQARLAFGNFDAVREGCREARGLRLLDNLRRELAYAARLLRKTPGISVTALATLAICLGANLTIFAVVQSILLRPLPFPAPDRLTLVYNTYPKAGVPDDGCSITNYYERRGHIAAFASLDAYRDGNGIIGEPGSTEREWITQVSPGFFATLGIAPAMGRAFTDDDMLHQSARVVILTDAVLAATLQRRSGCARSIDPCQRLPPHGGRRPSGRLSFFVLESAAVFPVVLQPRGPRARSAALGQLDPHDCAPEAGGDTGRCAGANRRAQRGDGTHESEGEDDRGCGLPDDRDAASCPPCRVDSQCAPPRAGRSGRAVDDWHRNLANLLMIR